MTRYIVRPTKKLIADHLTMIRKDTHRAQQKLTKDDLEAVFEEMDQVITNATVVQKMLAERQTKLKEAADAPLRAKRFKVQELKTKLAKLQVDLQRAESELHKDEPDAG